ncbi:hypothetical protein Taro_048449, partial [Colocasia esculenta]|nr:hypothetical protein [Colocasia esculenta]
YSKSFLKGELAAVDRQLIVVDRDCPRTSKPCSGYCYLSTATSWLSAPTVLTCISAIFYKCSGQKLVVGFVVEVHFGEQFDIESPSCFGVDSSYRPNWAEEVVVDYMKFVGNLYEQIDFDFLGLVEVKPLSSPIFKCEVHISDSNNGLSNA